jgi:hypothetical protein
MVAFALNCARWLFVICCWSFVTRENSGATRGASPAAKEARTRRSGLPSRRMPCGN